MKYPLAAFYLLLFLSSTVNAQANLDDKAPLIPLTEAIEVEHILFSTNSKGNITHALFRPCPSCAQQQEKITNQTEFFIGNQRISDDVALQFSGKAGAIEIDIHTKRLLRVRFF